MDEQNRTTGEIVLEARELCFDYDGIRALAGGNLRVVRGENLALLGHNGSGKSTLFLHLNGSLKPRHGEVLYRGKPIGYGRTDMLALRRRVGLVMQNPDDQLFAATVGQDVSFGPMNLGWSEAEVRDAVHEAMCDLDIVDLADRPTHRLSFGQKKRVVLAGVMAMSPEVLLLDEPTSGLDACGGEELLDALDRLKAKGVTMVVATHDVDFAWRWADAAAVIHEGKLTDGGDMAKLFAAGEAGPADGIHRPQLLDVYLTLLEKGLVPAGGPAPRTVADLGRMLGGGQEFSATLR